MKKKKQSDAAFINKIKTLNFSTGSSEEKCEGCGGPMTHHYLAIPLGRPPPRHKPSDEESFSA